MTLVAGGNGISVAGAPPTIEIDWGFIKRAVNGHAALAEAAEPEFLEWIAARLIRLGDDPNVDFVQALRRKAAKARAALAEI